MKQLKMFTTLLLAGVLAAAPGVAPAGVALDGPGATVRADGAIAGMVAFGLPSAPGWQPARGGDFEAGGAEYLFYDLAAASVPSAEGMITADLVRGNVSSHEALFGFADANWDTLFSVQVHWTDPLPAVQLYQVGVARLGLPVIHDGTVSFRSHVAQGEPVRVVLTWKVGRLEVEVNGEVIGSWSEATGLTGAIEAARYLVVGAETSAELPAGGAYSTLGSRLTAFRVYDTFAGTDTMATIASVAAEKSTYGTGQEIVVTLRGTMDLAASFDIRGVASGVSMEEVDDGVYVGRVTVPAGANLVSADVTGTLADLQTGESVVRNGAPITLDSVAPDGAPRIIATAPWAGEIEISWEASPSVDVFEYRIYRGEGADPVVTAAPYDVTHELSFVDTGVIPGIEYRYAVVPVDQAGNAGAASEIVSASAVAGDGPTVTGVSLEPFGRPAKPGDSITVTVTGQSAAAVGVSIGDLVADLALVESGRSGIYASTYTVPDTAVAATRSDHRVVVTMTDDYGQTVLAGPQLLVIGEDALNDYTPPVIADASHDGWQVAGFSGKLVAGDVLTVSLEGEPNGYASFAIDGVTDGVAMSESPAGSGSYSGSYTVTWVDEGVAAQITATLADEAGNATSTQVGRPLAFDTRVRLTVTARDTLLPADSDSQTRLVVKAEDANGDDVSGHELSLTLSTTEEYTGVVGGGDLEGRRATKDDEDDLEVKWGGTTDTFGEVAATYTAGFAAKTALIVAKDLTTGDVGAGWLNTYVASTVAITLTPVGPRAMRAMADQAILTLSADPAKLTADGRSKSRLTATLRDLSGNPIEGARISFALAGDNGRLRILDSRTDNRGVAEASYRAGTAIGTVTVTAASTDYGVTAAVQITLLSDAPAKIDLVASAVSLPADGKATANLAMRVTDIHDNPNAEVPVTLSILEGTGDLSVAELLTDRNGEGSATYTAGRSAGIVEIEARHTSRAPTQEELRRIYGTVFVPTLTERQDRERIKVAEWLVDPGDDVTQGQSLVTLESRKASWTLTAPETGIFVREVKHRRDRVELGDTLGYVEIDVDVWEADYVR